MKILIQENVKLRWETCVHQNKTTINVPEIEKSSFKSVHVISFILHSTRPSSLEIEIQVH